jgi:AraC family transcriptional regulator of adaptative response/methylated-DNA-[protein]-cysteine methyltransferase
MTPNAWMNGGAGVSIYWAVAETALGTMLLAATDKGICRLSFDENESALKRRFPNATLLGKGGPLSDLIDGAVSAIQNPRQMPQLPLDIGGTDFQMAVWQASGTANGANHVSVLIPCHRVIRSDGGLGGYAYGLERKRRLLAWESGQGGLFPV